MDDFANTASRSKRFVELVITSKTMSGPELEKLLGLAGDVVRTAGEQFLLGGTRRRRLVSALFVKSVGRPETQGRVDPGMPIEHHLESLYRLLMDHRSELLDLHEAGAAFKLGIMQEMDAGESQGHGIPIDANWVSLLAQLGAGIDIDQYVVGGPDAGSGQES